MHYIHPFKETKNQVFTIRLSIDGHTNPYGPTNDPNYFYYIDRTYIANISKDGGAFVQSTNVPVMTLTPDESGFYNELKLVLTADEMNADSILVDIMDAASGNDMMIAQSYLIYTQVVSSSITPQQIWEYENRELSAPVALDLTSVVTDVNTISNTNPTIREVLSMVWQSLCKTPHRKGWSFNKWINRI